MSTRIPSNNLFDRANLFKQMTQSKQLMSAKAEGKNLGESKAESPQFKMEELSQEENKFIENFMDRKFSITSENLLEEIQKFYSELLSNDRYRNLRRNIVALSALIAPALNSYPAAAVEQLNQFMIRGNVTYTKFMEAVSNHQIAKVTVDPTGRFAEYFNMAGGKGNVSLVPDPDFLNTLIANNVDLMVKTTDKMQDQILQLLGSAVPPLLLLGLFLLFSRSGPSVGFGGGANPFQMGKSKARF
mmetsp:Transcript_16364/g.27675  ORF Transcript_16364/g.27675 Transcript_16364/m.27675 type:complete len:244 (+) Transcript_16364:567-1298(+)